jgi:hypothetical protein
MRPGWFDDNASDQHRLLLLQGDTRQAGDASDGAIARRQIAQVLVASLSSAAAARKTFELVAEHGPAPTDLDPLFAALEPDAHGVLDGVHDMANMALSEEPARVQDDLKALGTWRNRP